ncbi:MAG: KAP family NTPase [Porticoccaceae bacterium]|nr:KAP family NTPase [Porticoccaceae bacterium]
MSDSHIEEDYSFNVLYEQVSDEDLFEDKPHEKVSDTLYKIIEKASKGLTIGLEGNWGSGKSTVINLLKNKLERDSGQRTLFFMFDAWAHDGDPLRKIFLESLILAIDPHDKDPELSEIKYEVSARKKSIDVKTKKAASKLGKFLSASALFIPVGAALLSAVDYEKVLTPWNGFWNGPHWLVWFGLLLSLSPVLVLLMWAFFGDTKEGRRTWDVFESTSREDYTQDITEDGERTSIEFERFFARILDYTLGQPDKSQYDRAVIVIDNLDRVEPEHAKNIWSTLQTFFQHRASATNKHSPWGDRLWFIVPFDRAGLSRIWETDSKGNNSGIYQNGLAPSFLGKSFQLTAGVPEPVMSAWVDYLDVCIEKSLSGWPERQRKAISETYQRFGSNLEQSPTPREIRFTINQAGMLGLAWGGKVSAEAICLFAILRQRSSERELRVDLLKEGLPKGYQSRIPESDIKSELAGLLFGVSKDKGMQLLLAPEIHTALRDADGKHLAELAERHSRAFWVVWEAKKSAWLPTDTHTDDYKIAFTSAICRGLSGHFHHLTHDILQLEKVWKDSVDRWELDKHDYAEPMSEIIKASSSPSDFLNWLKQKTSIKLADIIKKVGTDKLNKDELPSLNKLILLLDEESYPLMRSPYSSLNVENWKAWLSVAKEQSLNFKMVLPAKGAIENLVSDANFDQNTQNTKAISYLRQTFNIHPESSEWAIAAEKMISWANLPSREINCEAFYDLYLQLMTTQNSKTTSKLKKSASEEPFWQRSSQSPIEENGSLIMLAAIACEDELQKLPHIGSLVKTFWSSKHEDKTTQKLFNSLKDLNKLEILWLLSRDDTNLLAIQIIRINLNSELFSLPEGTMYLDEQKWLEEDETENFAQLLCQHGSFEKHAESMSGKADTYHKVFAIFNRHGDDKARSFINSEISNITSEEWKNHLDTCNDLLKCINTKNHKFSDAFTDFLIDTVRGEIEPKDWIWKNFDDLLSKAVDIDAIILPKISEAYFKSDTDHLNKIAFHAIAPKLEKHLHLIPPQDYMKRINAWIDGNSQERISWLLEHDLQQTETPLESLTERVKEALESQDIPDKTVFEALNKKLGLQIVPRDEDTISEEDTEKNE